MHCRILLNEIHPTHASLFTMNPMAVGQAVALTLEEPKRIYARGRITDCQETDSSSPIISQQPFSYRISVSFQFESPDEEKAFKEYCDSIAREYIYSDEAA